MLSCHESVKPHILRESGALSLGDFPVDDMEPDPRDLTALRLTKAALGKRNKKIAMNGREMT